MSDTTQDTAEVVWAEEEAKFVKLVLKQAGGRDTTLEKSAELIEEKHGTKVEWIDPTNDMASDPPTPIGLLENFHGESERRWEGTLTDYQALQTALTVYIMEATAAGQSVYEMLETIEGIQTKIRAGVQELGGNTVGPDSHPVMEQTDRES